MSAAGDILAGELGDIREALKRTWNALTAARLPIGRTDFVSGCIDRALDQATAAISVLEGAEVPVKRTAWNPAEIYRTRVAQPVSVPTVIGQLDDARQVIRKAREALRVPYLDGFLDRAQDQTSTVIRALTQEAEAGMAWYNALTEAERGHWHRVADSAVPEDAWKAYQQQAEEARP